MADENVCDSCSENPDPQVNGIPGDDITHLQEQQFILNRPPKSLVDWLMRVHLRLLALENEEANDSD